jgi:hypothetical protein
MEKWIKKATPESTKGALRKSLHVKKGHNIPASKLEKATHSKNPTTRKRATLAKTLKAMHHGEKKMSHVSEKRINDYSKKRK